MPLYSYICTICKTQSDHIHAMSQVEINCPICNEQNSLQKIFPNFLKKYKTVEKKGKLVHQTIDETKEELKDIKNILKNRTLEAIKK